MDVFMQSLFCAVFEYVFAILSYFRDLDVGMLIRLDLCISLGIIADFRFAMGKAFDRQEVILTSVRGQA